MIDLNEQEIELVFNLMMLIGVLIGFAIGLFRHFQN